MIYLEVEKSNDPLSFGLYEYEFDQVTIGRSKKNDLIFLDKELPLRFLVIKYLQGNLVVKSLVTHPFFFVNGKKVSGTLKINANDTIAFGPNLIRVVQAKMGQPPIDLSSAYEKFNTEASDLKCALDFMEQVILDLEKDSNV
jgi:hypothetical protein